VVARTIETATHGRYVVEPASIDGPAPMLIGFHGYAEAAETMLARLRASAGADRWICVAVQGLNRFYQRRTDEVIAGWMTRQDRELAIADNIAYVERTLDAVAREWPASSPVVFAGFSQGTAMAFRAAAASTRAVTSVIAVGGDIPPELSDRALVACGNVLLCRGRNDEWYTSDKFAADRERLQRAGISTRALEFDGGHEWSAPVASAVSEFLLEARR
jgi:predicted esterase